ncbi:MAG: metallophosphoesterase [Firmicutes bacterium]|nr:metallophosphoesterase [Bacillota bacterium]
MLIKKKVLNNLFVFILIVGVLTVSLATIASTMPVAAKDVPSHIILTWTGDARTTQTITWQTDANTQDGQVQYWEVRPGHLGEQINLAAQVKTVVSNKGEFNVHTATITGLKPGTRYAYRIGIPGTWSQQAHFATAPVTGGEFKFLVFGDSQSINYDTWRTTLHNAYQANLDTAFFINMGDLIDMGQDYSQWDAWFNATQGVLENIPCMPVVGNHETYAPERRLAMPTLFTDQFKLPMNGPEGLKGQVYSFNYADVHFVMLDTQIDEEGRFVPDMLEKQKHWLEEDLATAGEKWKLVFVHKAPYNNKPNGNPTIRTGFAPIIEKYHADLVFTAHDHVYAHTYPMYNGMAVENPTKGTIYVATGRSGSKTYSTSIAKEWDDFFYNPLDEPNYLTVEVNDNILTVTAYRQNGGLIDKWSIVK